jgi:dTDP-4-dehydrorhamnose reductase
MPAQRVVIIGANGQLGTDLCEYYAAQSVDVVPLTHSDIVLEDESSVRAALAHVKPTAILNTAAFHHVPKCEDDPARAYAVNAIGARSVARAAEKLGAAAVYYSTDYVFDGAKKSAYIETDRPNPLNVYASSKLAGEHHTISCCTRGYVLRVSGLYGRVPCRAKGGNFVTTMLRAAKEKPEVRVVVDEVLTPTPTTEIARITDAILRHGVPGLYHATCEGECSWYEFARVIFETLHLSTPLLPAHVRDFPPGVKRPFYSVLENAMLKSEAIPPMPHWKDSLVSFLRRTYGGAS